MSATISIKCLLTIGHVKNLELWRVRMLLFTSALGLHSVNVSEIVRHDLEILVEDEYAVFYNPVKLSFVANYCDLRQHIIKKFLKQTPHIMPAKKSLANREWSDDRRLFWETKQNYFKHA